MIGKARLSIPILTLLIIVAGANACNPGPSSNGSPVEDRAVTPLPPPTMNGEMPLEEALVRRRSVRKFDAQTLTSGELGQLLWAAQGITDERGRRTAPSAGALYPLEVYVATADGVFHYQPQGHQLLVTSPEDGRERLYKAASNQESVRQAPAVFIVTAVYERTSDKYGAERSERYVHLEAGHAAQNLLLEAVALGLGAVSIGSFHDKQVQKALGLPADHQPLYLIPVGLRQEANR